MKPGANCVVETDDRLKLSLSDDGRVVGVTAGRRRLPASGPGGFSVQEVLPPAGSCVDHGAVAGTVRHRRSTVEFHGRLPAARLELDAIFRGGKFIDVRGCVRDLTGRERAVKVTFTLPVRLTGWRWENTLLSGRTVRAGTSYPLVPDDVMYLDRRGDGFANEDPTPYTIPINKLPFSTVSRGAAALALACPLHQPRVFLIRASDRGYSITFHLGLSPETANFPSRADFRFVLYPVDPAWGIRSAAERYFRFFPELFAGRARRHGNFGFFYLSKLKDRPRDFGWAYMENDFQWTGGQMSAEQADVARRLGLRIVHWRNPWVFHTPLDAPFGPDATPEKCLTRLRQWAAGKGRAAAGDSHGQNCGASLREASQAALNCHLLDEQGRFMRGVHDNGRKPYWVFPMNMDPALPRPNRYGTAADWQYRYVNLWKRRGFRGPFGFAWDATDDFDSFRRLNFRREHFRTVSMPLTFDPLTGALCQVKGFHDWEFGSRFTAKVRSAGGIIMANTTIEQSMMFIGAHIDVFVRERSLLDNDEERLSVMRVLAGRKPISFIGHWNPRDEAGLAEESHKAFLFGIAPGADGPGREGETAERAVFKGTMPAFSRMAAAGWEPVTHARARRLSVERFGGRGRNGPLFFAVRNSGNRRLTDRVEIDGRALGLSGALEVVELFSGRALPAARRGRQVSVEIEVEPRRTRVLCVTRRKRA